MSEDPYDYNLDEAAPATASRDQKAAPRGGPPAIPGGRRRSHLWIGNGAPRQPAYRERFSAAPQGQDEDWDPAAETTIAAADSSTAATAASPGAPDSTGVKPRFASASATAANRSAGQRFDSKLAPGARTA